MNMTRRSFLKAASLLSLSPAGGMAMAEPAPGEWVNDVHSQLNRTRVNRIVPVDSVDALRRAIETARQERRAISIAGGRHAMGGQQFRDDGILMDTTKLEWWRSKAEFNGRSLLPIWANAHRQQVARGESFRNKQVLTA